MAKRPNTAESPSSPNKFPKEEPLSPCKVSVADNHATVSGVLTMLSPIRPKKYFDGELTDGEATMRLVGFDKSKLDQLRPFCEYELPVTLRDCNIKRSVYNDTLEIVLRNHTKIEHSTMGFKIADLKTAGSLLIPLKEVNSLPQHKRVTVQATVIKVHEPKQAKTTNKQDITIADESSKATLTLWGSDVGTVELNASYQFNRLEIRIFMGKVYLSFPSAASFARINPIENLITNDSSSSSDEEEDLAGASIIGLKDMETQYGCVNCNKTVTPTDSQTGTCDTCDTTQMLHPKVSAKLIIKCGDTKVTLKAFDDAIQAITQQPTSPKTSPQDLLFTPPFRCSYNKFHIITKISH